jgi:hypothetical protein
MSRGEDNRIPPRTMMIDVTSWTHDTVYQRNAHTQTFLHNPIVFPPVL